MKYIGSAAMALATMTLAGCDTLTGGDLVRPGTTTGTLTIVNATYGNLDAIVMSECSAMSYGFNRLETGDYIPQGGARSFTVSAGCWDVGGGEWAGVEGYKRVQVPAYGSMTLTITE
ncbi:hypothetical protein [Devosia sediminis]|uniref:Lipoprotein n=1 Tax=Devosia sediminis TaxID=2798801 RepID=A0A934ITZ4_9HYPH|nr:hypothetical protein [Devosia sediminis]MBJ3785106.1 hypothetical protein [Devosia sediminis]